MDEDQKTAACQKLEELDALHAKLGVTIRENTEAVRKLNAQNHALMDQRAQLADLITQS